MWFLVSPAASIIVRLDPDKLYLDSCASHAQVYLTRHPRDTFEMQIGFHTISNGGQNTAGEIGMLLEAIRAWLVRSGMANLFSIPELERMGFSVQSDTYANWVVTSPEGTKLVFQRDTGRCEGFPFVHLNDPVVIEFVGKICEDNIERMTQEIAFKHFFLPWPSREDHVMPYPVKYLIPESYGAVLLQSGEQKKGDNYTKKDRCYRLCIVILKDGRNEKLRRPH